MVDLQERWNEFGRGCDGCNHSVVWIGLVVGAVRMIAPERIAESGTEHSHQVALMQWVAGVWRHEKGWMLHAIPNGGDRSMSVGAKMKAEGVRKGVPDLCWPIRRWSGDGRFEDHYSGLYLEMKRPSRGSLSEEQLKFLTALRAEGYAVAVAWGWQAAAWVLFEYEAGRLAMPEGDGPLLAMKTEQAPV